MAEVSTAAAETAPVRRSPRLQLRRDVGFLDLCKNPKLCAEVMVSAVERLGVDAAIHVAGSIHALINQFMHHRPNEDVILKIIWALGQF